MILEAMDLLRVEAALLRAQLPELVLRPGMTLPARVMERHGQMGLLLLAGTPLSAQLPDELKAGDRLRLRVEDVGAQIVLRTVEAPAPQAAATPPPQLALPLPNGASPSRRPTAAAKTSPRRSRWTTTRPHWERSQCASCSSPAAPGSR
jgi:hypothetical protein